MLLHTWNHWNIGREKQYVPLCCWPCCENIQNSWKFLVWNQHLSWAKQGTEVGGGNPFWESTVEQGSIFHLRISQKRQQAACGLQTGGYAFTSVVARRWKPCLQQLFNLAEMLVYWEISGPFFPGGLLKFGSDPSPCAFAAIGALSQNTIRKLTGFQNSLENVNYKMLL